MAFDKNIPLPVKAGGRTPKNPAFRKMEVGDSVFTPHDGSILTCPAYMYAKTIQKRSDVYEFSGRTVIEDGVRGVRVWRVA